MKFKRFSCLFLALILMLSIAPFSAFAVETDGAETFEINLFDALAINQRSNVADFVFDAATNTVTFTKTAGVDKNAYVGYDIYLPAGTYYLTAENVVSTVDNTASWKLNRGSVEVDFGHLKAAPSDGDKTVNVEESGTYSIRISARYADPEGTAYTISKIKFVPVNPEFEFDVTNLFDVTKIAHQSQVADFVRDAATSTVEFTKTASGFKNAYVGYSCYLPAGTYYLTADTVASTAVSTENTASWKLNLSSKEVDGGHLTVSPNEGEKTVNIEKDGTYSVRISARYADPSGTEYTISNIKLVSADQPYGPNLFDVSKITQESEVSDFAIDPNTNTVSFTKTASGFNNAYVGYDIELSAGTYYLTADTVMSTAASTENTASWKLNRGSVEVDNGHLRDSASELEKTVNVEESGVYSIRISARYADPRGTE